MLFISADDFLNKVKSLSPLTREEEKILAVQKAAGDAAAREKLVQGYLPFTAGFIRRAPRGLRTLNTVYTCIDCLEKSVDSFDFLQDRERFARPLGQRLRHCITRCLANRP